jgi:hypothetical protein
MLKIEPEARTCPICTVVFLVGGTGRPKRSQRYCSTECGAAAQKPRGGSIAKELSPIFAAYLAGVVDSDGHVALYGRKNRDGVGVYRPHLSVVNTYKPLLERIQEETGVGGVCVQHKETDRRKTSYVWNSVSEAATTTLSQLLPYLLVKKDRAELAIDFYQRRMDPIKKADLSWQNEYRERMLAMNRRGPVSDSRII